ncbi:Rhodanese-like protein [Candidatus Terasakiella magnetica]|uniref:Rhodanese-like protein n=1 Tax=Candidatus Terasakiella magnetica TaxID=1867952 RepID=A0A1C3RER8_9PROT|nr:rhodanese-like domain-containing protein [Candidatus Terasakiella magnetica]SCA55777.1 Rhodanese-like protein [Candidatus Terasakiella magnetica]
MKAVHFSITLFASLFLIALNLNAADVPKKETALTKSGLYVTALEAYDILQKDQKALLIDVRDPVEIMFTGWTNDTDIHVPFRIVDRTRVTGKSFEFPLNETFMEEVEEKLAEYGANKSTTLLFMCRSGSTRSAPAASMFFELGYKNSYTIVDGFEGGKLKEGNSMGVRAKNGWRNSGLPWTYTLDSNKLYTVFD